MVQIRQVIFLFIIVNIDNIYCVSVVTEKEIENAAQRELKRRDTVTGNFSLEARSGTERWIEFEKFKTPSGASVSIDSSERRLLERVRSQSFSLDHYDENYTRYDNYETAVEDNINNIEDDDDEQENDGLDDGAIDEEPEEEIVPYSRRHGHHRHVPAKPRQVPAKQRKVPAKQHKVPANKRLAHTPHKKIRGKSYVKLPTGVFVYINKYERLMKISKCGKKGILLKLKPGDYEYKLMANEMQSTIQAHSSLRFKKYIILKVERVINGCLLRKYVRRQGDIKLEYNHLNERILFHGTYKVRELLAAGFDERYASIDGMFGAGMYFAKHSSKSNQYAFGHGGQCDKHKNRHCQICERKMLICRVTLGKIKKVTQARRGIAHPPPGFHSLQGVASNVTRGLKYNEYIIYRGEQAYPEYVISYKLKP